MFKLSNIVGKPIISLYNGQIEGIITNAIFDKKLQKVKYFLIINETNDETLELNSTLLTKDIYHIGQDAIVIKNNSYIMYSNLSDETKLSINPINCDIFTTLGEKIGVVKDVIFDEHFNVINLELADNNTISIKNIANYSNELIIMQDETKSINISKFGYKKPKIQNTNEVVKILRKDNQLSTHPTTLPQKITIRTDLMIGRTINENIYSQSKEIIAKKGTIISQKIIDNAKKYGKIKELYMFSA